MSNGKEVNGNERRMWKKKRRKQRVSIDWMGERLRMRIRDRGMMKLKD